MPFMQIRDRRPLSRLFLGEVLVAMVAMNGPAWAGSPIRNLEDEVVAPRYSAIQPTRTNTNIEGIVIACNEAEGNPILQLHIYLAGRGPFLPKNASPERLKDFPSAAISIDDLTFEAGVFFSDHYVIVADDTDGYPRLSDQLTTAMLAGRTMILRFDLVQESISQPIRFDGEAVIDLSADAIDLSNGVVRQCIDRPLV